MKKIIILSLILMIFTTLTSSVTAESTELIVEDLTTLNFHTRANEIDFQAVKKICSYDFCSYRRGESMKEALEIFTNDYLAIVKDEEARATLKIKGIRITKIVFMNPGSL